MKNYVNKEQCATLSTEDLKIMFNRSGQRFTTQREAIWQLFTEHPKGLSIARATTMLADRKISPTTIYRTVNTLKVMGLLRWVNVPEGEHRFLISRPGHTHMLVCRSCAQAVECSDCDLSILEQLIAHKTGFTVEGHHLEFYGLCPDCS